MRTSAWAVSSRVEPWIASTTRAYTTLAENGRASSANAVTRVELRIERVPQPVAEEVDPERGQGEGGPGRAASHQAT